MKRMKVLITQPEPEDKNSSYHNLAEKYNLDISFVPFISINAIEKVEFRNQKVKILDHTAVILSSRNAVDHFFHISSLLNITIPGEMKYFCSSEHIANYLQKYISPKRRKIFHGKKHLFDLSDKFKIHKNERFLIVSSQNSKCDITDYLKSLGIEYTEATFFNVSSRDLSDLSINDFDLLAFFSHGDLKALYDNFPDFQQKDKLIACYGQKTIAAAQTAGLTVNIEAPVLETLSMTDALDLYLKHRS